MGEKIIDIENNYSVELEKIRYILSGLENGRIYELNNGSAGDGSLAKNVGNLKKELNVLFHKIQHGKESESDEMNDLF